MPRHVLIRIVLDTLAGLQAAHDITDDEGRELNLVHRDCSPQNILVGVDGCSRLTDFGIARASSRLASTRSLQLKGKLPYMAPEQARGQALDRRTDVFAMGAVLWEGLSGRQLFNANNEAAILSRVVLDSIPLLRAAAPTASPSLEAVCAKALERDLDRRYQSAAEMAYALERAAHDEAGAPEGGVASPREVAAYVQSVLGEQLAAQREAVRAVLHSRPSGAEAECSEGPDEDDTLPFSREPHAAKPEAASVQPPGVALSTFPAVLLARRRRGRLTGGAILAALSCGALVTWTALQSGRNVTDDAAQAGALGGPSEPAGSLLATASLATASTDADESATGQPGTIKSSKPQASTAPRRAAPASWPRKPASKRQKDTTLPGYMADPYR
jgi:eukaryotic-like serine/threonine-protein kinase